MQQNNISRSIQDVVNIPCKKKKIKDNLNFAYTHVHPPQHIHTVVSSITLVCTVYAAYNASSDMATLIHHIYVAFRMCVSLHGILFLVQQEEHTHTTC